MLACYLYLLIVKFLHLINEYLHSFSLLVFGEHILQLIVHLIVFIQGHDIKDDLLSDLLGDGAGRVHEQRPAEVFASLHQVVSGEVIVLEGTFIVPAEGTLDRVDGRDLQLIEHGYSGSRFLRLLTAKSGVLEHKEGTHARHEEGE
jgi:hypothetical protein